MFSDCITSRGPEHQFTHVEVIERGENNKECDKFGRSVLREVDGTLLKNQAENICASNS
jgi:hypothetical protein